MREVTKEITYDALNRRVSATDALGNTARAAYDANGRQTSATDANGRAKTTVYDLAGRPTEQANEMGQKTRYGYDKLGNRLTLTDAGGNVTRWTFDVFGRETSMTFPNGDKETYEYDRLGRMTAKTKPDGTVIRYEYDRLGRLVKIVTPDGEIIYEYDAWGRVAKEVSPTRTLTCEYDRLGRLIAVADSFTGKTVRYAYNRLGAREKLTLDGIDVTYKYDRLLRLSEVQKTGEAAPAQYEHDAAGRRVALKLPNGVTTTYAHDAAGRLTKVESKNAAGNVISAFGYALDATGNRTAMDVTLNGIHNHIEYAFDNAYRLTRETRTDAAGNVLYDEGFGYDPVGNRLTRARTQIAIVNGAPQSVTENTVYAYNNANQLLTETTNGVTTAYGYDKNGNNTTIAAPAANGAPAKHIAMTYDWLNRQTRWSDGARTESTVFAGADWKRASTTVSGAGVAAQTVKYLYDGDNVLADYDATNALTAFYVTPGLDQNLSITDASGAKSYYTQDGLGSVRLLTSANGAILNHYDYTAFGETFASNTSATTPNRYTYTAREQSPLAAHGAPMYYRWRNYAPEVGRFMWRDPIGYKGGVNVYGYVDGIPSINKDPSGLQYEEALQCPCNLNKIKDDANHECCLEEMGEVILHVKKPNKSFVEQIYEMIKKGYKPEEILGNAEPGHAFVEYSGEKIIPPEKGVYGFWPTGDHFLDMGGYKGEINDDSHVHSTNIKTYKACPYTRDKMRTLIETDKTNPPKYHVLSPKGTYNCTTWAIKILRETGFDVNFANNILEPFDLANSFNKNENQGDI